MTARHYANPALLSSACLWSSRPLTTLLLTGFRIGMRSAKGSCQINTSAWHDSHWVPLDAHLDTNGFRPCKGSWGGAGRSSDARFARGASFSAKSLLNPMHALYILRWKPVCVLWSEHSWATAGWTRLDPLQTPDQKLREPRCCQLRPSLHDAQHFIHIHPCTKQSTIRMAQRGTFGVQLLDP